MLCSRNEVEICKTISFRITLIIWFAWSKVISLVYSVRAST